MFHHPMETWERFEHPSLTADPCSVGESLVRSTTLRIVGAYETIIYIDISHKFQIYAVKVY